MDFNKLAEPYNKKPERQRAFILRNGIPPDIADAAMIEVYKEVAEGLVFSKPADFDFRILKVAREKVAQGHKDRIETLQTNLEWSGLSKFKKIVKVIKGKV